MKILVISLFVLFSCVSAFAQSDKAPPIQPEDVIGFLIEDFNDDGSLDKALLVQGSEDVDLFLYLASDGGEMTLAVHNPDIVWSGMMYGTIPRISQHPETKSLKYACFFAC